MFKKAVTKTRVQASAGSVKIKPEPVLSAAVSKQSQVKIQSKPIVINLGSSDSVQQTEKSVTQ